jgi:hypothetical protein
MFMFDIFRKAALAAAVASAGTFAHANVLSFGKLDAGLDSFKANDQSHTLVASNTFTGLSVDAVATTSVPMRLAGDDASKRGPAAMVGSASLTQKDDPDADVPVTEPGRIALFALGLVGLGFHIGRRGG